MNSKQKDDQIKKLKCERRLPSQQLLLHRSPAFNRECDFEAVSSDLRETFGRVMAMKNGGAELGFDTVKCVKSEELHGVNQLCLELSAFGREN